MYVESPHGVFTVAITIGSNIAAIQAQRRLGNVTDEIGDISTRLSSGQRINKASDDAAGLAISSSLSSETRVYSQGIRNINDGVSVLNVAEGALSQLNEITQRQKELAEQSANGVYSAKQRKALNSEANALVEEFNRITNVTTFNGQKLLSGEFKNISLQAGFGSDGVLSIGVGSDLSRAVGTGTYSAGFSAAPAAGDVQAIDLNGDGNIDLVIPASPAFFGNGDGTFRTGTASTPNSNITNTFVDLNNDGRVDYFGINGTGPSDVTVWLQAADGTFSQIQTMGINPSGNWRTISDDFNGDGFKDLVVFDSSSNPGDGAVFFNNGNGTFSAAQTLTFQGNPSSATSADLNADGINDLVVTNANFSDSSIGIFYGQKTGGFSAPKFLYSGVNNPGQVFAADFNRDGAIDILCANGAFSSILFANGRNDYSYSGNLNFVTRAVVDSNGDGFEDVIGFGSGVIQTYLGNGDGTFGQISTAPITFGNFGRTNFADFNNDGVQDVYDANYGSNVFIHLANTNQTATIAHLNLMTRTSALAALDVITATQTRISKEISKIGSYQSRLSITASVLYTTTQQYAAAKSRIVDVDVAEETARLGQTKILQQAAASVLSQANLQPQIALRLLQS